MFKVNAKILRYPCHGWAMLRELQVLTLGLPGRDSVLLMLLPD